MELFSVELEQSVLGACIKNNMLVDKLASVLSVEDFYDPFHRRISAKMQHMHGLGEHITPASLAVSLSGDSGLAETGGSSYFAAMESASPALPNIYSLGKSVKDLSTKRSLQLLAENLSAGLEEGKAQDHIETAEKALYALAEKAQYGSRLMNFGEATKLAIKQAEAAQRSGGKIVGIPTGLTDIDNMLGGLQKSDLLIIAGRPGMGKTALATNIAFHAATIGHPMLFFSLEMSAQQLSMRILAEQSGVEMWKIRNGQMRDPEWTDYVLTGQKFEKLPLHIDDTGGITLPQLASRARRAKREHSIEGIVVDYIQLMDGTRAGSYQQNRTQELTHITKGLKSLAKELDVPIIALSQLSRGVDARDDKRPVLSDLRESGSIEQDADVVAFVFRKEYYIKSREPDVSDPNYHKWQEDMEKCHGLADVIVEKHRHGATGTVHLGFDGRFTKFKNLE